MRQVILNPKSGKIEVIEIPAPKPAPKQILVRNLFSVISAGTERSTVSFAQQSLIQKAKNKPKLISKEILDKIGSKGILPTALFIIARLGLSKRVDF